MLLLKVRLKFWCIRCGNIKFRNFEILITNQTVHGFECTKFSDEKQCVSYTLIGSITTERFFLAMVMKC